MKYTNHMIVLLGILVVILISIVSPLNQFTSPTIIINTVQQFDVLAPIIYIIFITLAVPFNIPSTPLIFAGGYIFGVSKGILFSLIAMILGSTLAFYLTRVGGKPLLQRVVSKKYIKKYNQLFKKHGLTFASISYLIPLFPTDAVSLFLGLTQLRYRLFFILVTLTHIPRIILIIFLGHDLYAGFSYKTAIIAAVAVLGIGVALIKDKGIFRSRSSPKNF